MFAYFRQVVVQWYNGQNDVQQWSDYDDCDSQDEPKELTRLDGILTSLSETFGVIDSRHTFHRSMTSDPLKVGDKLWYDVHYSEDGRDVLGVVAVGLNEEETWNQDEDGEAVVYTEKATVVLRQARSVVLSNDTTLHLDNVRINGNYNPCAGDRVKYGPGKDEVPVLCPDNRLVRSGVVSHFNGKEGVISPDVAFTKYDLDDGYDPIVGDHVSFTAVETDAADKLKWRAIQVSFDDFHHDEEPAEELDELDIHMDAAAVQILGKSDFGDILLSDTGLAIKLQVLNSSKREQTLERVKFRRPQQQLAIQNDLKLPIAIAAGAKIDVYVTSSPKFVGRTTEVLFFAFKGFVVAHRVNMTVSSNEFRNINMNPGNGQYRQRTNESVVRPEEYQRRTMGQRAWKRQHFRKTTTYTVPKPIDHFCFDYDSKPRGEVLKTARLHWPELTQELSPSNYVRKFQTLLYFDQMAHTVQLAKMSLSNVFLRRRGEYLVLDVPGLQEQRPSLIIGDQIVVTQPWREEELVAHSGVIHQVGRDCVAARFHDSFYHKYDDTVCNVQFEAGYASYFRQHDAIKEVAAKGKAIIFPETVSAKKPYIEPDQETMIWYNKTLNEGQRAAVMSALRGECRPLPYVIFGPPGTGKTVTLVEFILQAMRLSGSARILVGAPSNSSADLLCQRLIAGAHLRPDKLVRLMAFSRDPETVPEDLVEYSATISSDDDQRIKPDVAIGWHRITVGTCSVLSQLKNMELPSAHFTHIVIDEAGYCTEPLTTIPLSFLSGNSGMALLAGDPKQLGPVVLSEVAIRSGLAESYLERVMTRFPYARDRTSFPETHGFDPRIITRLTLNYRSVDKILQLPNKLFYSSELVATVTEDFVREREIIQGYFHSANYFLNFKAPSPIMFHGVRGDNRQDPDSPSWYNPQEMMETIRHLRILYKIGVEPDEIAVITPYKKQVSKIRHFLTEMGDEVPKVGSVEELQGQERQVIILSCVRSSLEHLGVDRKCSLGFLSNPKRVNVALTRARCLLIIMGNPHILARDPSWRAVINYCIQLNAYFGCDAPKFEEIPLLSENGALKEENGKDESHNKGRNSRRGNSIAINENGIKKSDDDDSLTKKGHNRDKGNRKPANSKNKMLKDEEEGKGYKTPAAITSNSNLVCVGEFKKVAEADIRQEEEYW